MTIYRDGKAIELTEDEMREASKELQLNFYIDELTGTYCYPEKEAGEIAEEAYVLYCEGDGKTEYECLEEALDKWLEENMPFKYEVWQDGCCIHEDLVGNVTADDATYDA